MKQLEGFSKSHEDANRTLRQRGKQIQNAVEKGLLEFQEVIDMTTNNNDHTVDSMLPI